MDENFDAPNEVVSPEALEFGALDEESEIHIGDDEEDIMDNALVVHEEES